MVWGHSFGHQQTGEDCSCASTGSSTRHTERVPGARHLPGLALEAPAFAPSPSYGEF